MSPEVAERFIENLGEAATLRRVIGPSLFDSVALKTVSSASFPTRPRDETGGVQQFRSQFIISNREIAAQGWPGPPRRGDQIVVGGRITTIESCDTRKIGPDIAMHWLLAEGSN